MGRRIYHGCLVLCLGASKNIAIHKFKPASMPPGRTLEKYNQLIFKTKTMVDEERCFDRQSHKPPLFNVGGI